MSCEELEIVWNNIKAEARTLADCEPMLASFYHATLLKHENLGSALSYMLANKLSSPIMPAIAIREVVEEAYAADPEMIASAACQRAFLMPCPLNKKFAFRWCRTAAA